MALMKCPECGKEISDQAKMCPQCGYAIIHSKDKSLNKIVSMIWTIIRYILAFGVIYYGIKSYVANIFSSSKFISTLIIIAGILILPMVSVLLKKIVKSKKLYLSLMVIKYFIEFSLLIVAFILIMKVDNPAYIYEGEALKTAEEFFHENVHLKNEDSYVLNDYTVEVYNWDKDKNWELVLVSLDYSAENGFGGNDRKTCVVSLLYHVATRKYSLYQISD